MKIVIDVPNSVYSDIMDDSKNNPRKLDYYERIIANGTSLPKGHGRLIDENELCEGRVSNDPVVIAAKCATTIIEADREGEQE